MISGVEFVLFIDNNVYETCIMCEISGNTQAASEENGDNDDDDVYDYAPAAWAGYISVRPKRKWVGLYIWSYEPWFCSYYINDCMAYKPFFNVFVVTLPL